jgi:hypothetical protein
MEPRPWPEDGATEIEKALLRAGRAEVPRKGADLRILAMIHGAAPPTIQPVTFTRWVKVGLIAMVAGGAALVGHQLSRPHPVSPSELSARAVVPEAVPSVLAPTEGRASGKAAISPEVSERLAATRDDVPRSVPDEGTVRGRRAIAMARTREAPQPPSDMHSLGEETKALDCAREALDAHRPSQVMRLLDGYRRKFPQGRLRPEATILRLAALVQAGRHQAADALASQLLSDEAYLPYEPRIQSLLREVKR